MAPWAKAYTVDMKDIYTELTLDKIENQPTGPEGKTIEDYKELFEDKKKELGEQSKKKPPKKVLLKADPGMGKTTFGKHLAYDWAKGIFKVFTIVFFVSLKLVKPDDTIENIIIQQTPALEGLNVKQQKIKSILDTLGSRCLIIFDGYDEFGFKNEEIMKMIQGRIYHKCNVVLTSRPHSVEDVDEHFQTLVKIQGFNEIHTAQFISKTIAGEEKVQAVLKFNMNNFLADQEQFTCPMLILFICILVNHDDLDLARKNVALGEIYFRLVRCIYRKYCVRVKLSYQNNKFLDFLSRIGTLAYDILLNQKPWYKRGEVIRIIGDDAFEFGILIGHEDFRLMTDPTSDIFIMFPHRTIQEFLGSFHMTKSLNLSEGPDPLFLIDLSLLHFCCWLTMNQSCDVGLNKTKAFSDLQDKFLHFYNVTLLDLITMNRIVKPFTKNDQVLVKFWNTLLSKCVKVKHLLLSTANPIGSIIKALGCIVSDLVSVWIIDKSQQFTYVAIDSMRRHFLSSGTTIFFKQNL